MSTPLDTESLAKEDIVARPEITGGKKVTDQEQKQQDKALKPKNVPDQEQMSMEPNRLEEAASAVMTESMNEVRMHFGGAENKNMTVLMQEMLNGGFAAIRMLSGRPWLSFVVATSAFGVALMPPILKRIMAKKEEEQDNGND